MDKWSHLGPLGFQFETTMYEYDVEVHNGKLEATATATTDSSSYRLPPQELPDKVANALATLMDYVATRDVMVS